MGDCMSTLAFYEIPEVPAAVPVVIPAIMLTPSYINFRWLYDIFGREFITILIPRLDINWFIDLVKENKNLNKSVSGGAGINSKNPYTETDMGRVLKQIMKPRCKKSEELVRYGTVHPWFDISWYFECGTHGRVFECEKYSWHMVKHNSAQYCYSCSKSNSIKYDTQKVRIRTMMQCIGYSGDDAHHLSHNVFTKKQRRLLGNLWFKFHEFGITRELLYETALF